MRYNDFERIVSSARMSRYYIACGNNSRKAMTLYRKNLKLSQELFTIISCFEIALRNSIDKLCISNFGNDWLRDSAISGGFFDNRNCNLTKRNINDAISNLPTYSHNKLVAELGFGFWRFMFANHQYRATNQTLLSIFPSKPVSTPTTQYNHTYIFNLLKDINELRNRIAHHEPVCFIPSHSIKDTTYSRRNYNTLLQLFNWMQINESAFLYGIDHINEICDEIDRL